MKLRPCQEQAIQDFKSWLATDSKRRLYISPTGSGKTVTGLTMRKVARSQGLVTLVIGPTDEILIGWGEKAEIHDTAKESLESHGFFTPIRLRNLLAQGAIPQPDLLIVDEAHHSEAETHQLIAALSGEPRQAGLTATGFRGNAKGTQDFKSYWGEPYVIVTLKDAAELGYISIPDCSIVPLLDDDIVTIDKGEFQVKSLDAATESIIPGIVNLCESYLGPPFGESKYDKATMIAMPSVKTSGFLHDALTEAGLPSVVVTGVTKAQDRLKAFDACINRTAILVQINVVSEGVDLPIRRLLDGKPTISPVQWQQRLGRIMRPGGTSEYICLNRNLLRHAYLLEGLLPADTYKEAEEKFEAPSKRSNIRTLGFEALGRFKGTDVPLASGLKATLYCVSCVEGITVTHYAAMASPLNQEILYARRTNNKKDDGTIDYKGHWERIDGIPDVTGFASVPAPRMSPAQKAWWVRDAAKYGLDCKSEVNARVFQALPILCNTRFFRFRSFT